MEISHNLQICDSGGIMSLWRQYLTENGNSCGIQHMT